MMDHRYSGRCSMYRSWLVIGLVGIAGWVNAAEAPLPELQSPESFSPEQVDLLVESLSAAEAAFLAPLLEDSDRSLDPAVFTEIAPMTVPNVAIRLPKDQEE